MTWREALQRPLLITGDEFLRPLMRLTTQNPNAENPMRKTKRKKKIKLLAVPNLAPAPFLEQTIPPPVLDVYEVAVEASGTFRVCVRAGTPGEAINRVLNLGPFDFRSGPYSVRAWVGPGTGNAAAANVTHRYTPKDLRPRKPSIG